MLYRAPQGTRDLLPDELPKWHAVEEAMRRICRLYGYRELRTPLFESTELFMRSVGEQTDIVTKEMYTFIDRGDRSLTLRPEGTASVVRAFLEHGLNNDPQPTKLYYYGPMFRYDRPQAGRYRQFYQFGVEFFGSPQVDADVEVILLGDAFLRSLGLSPLELQVNSVGCPQCREHYYGILHNYLHERVAELCPDCRERYQRNPLRILDCKQCAAIGEGAPSLLDYLCDECCRSFSELRCILEQQQVPYTVNPSLVRGLDYYTKTAFEFISPRLGSQASVGGGGRYDNLVELCGGPPVPGVGMAIGMDRLLLALDEQGQPGAGGGPRVFIIQDTGDRQESRSLRQLRAAGIAADMDYMGRSLKAQMKYAGRRGFGYVIILGGAGLASGRLILRRMDSSKQEELPRGELLARLTKEIGVASEGGSRK